MLPGTKLNPPLRPAQPPSAQPQNIAPKTIQLQRPSGALRVSQEPPKNAAARNIRLARPETTSKPPTSQILPKTPDLASKSTTARIHLDGFPGPASPVLNKPPSRIIQPPQAAPTKEKTAQIQLETPSSTPKSLKPPTRVTFVKQQQSILDEAAKNKTTRLVLSDSESLPSQKSKTGAPSVLSTEIASAETIVDAPRPPVSKKSTTRVVDLPATEQGKRTTSRIILEHMDTTLSAPAKRITDQVSSTPSAGPKTIRLKRPSGAIMVPGTQPPEPPATVRTIKLARPGAVPVAPSTIAATPSKSPKETSKIVAEPHDPQEAPTIQAKRSTARIEPSADDASQPATIQLRRPSTIVTVAPDAAQPSKPTKTETTRIELIQPSDQTPVTQQRTLKLRRPDVPQPAATEEKEEEEETSAKPEKKRALDIIPAARKGAHREREDEEEEGIHVVFSILSVVALLVLCMVAYVLAAQAFAPDFTLPLPTFLL